MTLDVTHNRYNYGDGEVLGHVGETRDASCLATRSRLRHGTLATHGPSLGAEPPSEPSHHLQYNPSLLATSLVTFSQQFLVCSL